MTSTEIYSLLIPVAALQWLNLLAPGPNVLLISRLAADGRPRDACGAAIGMSAMVLVWSLLAAAGLCSMLAADRSLGSPLRFAGGCWLLLLARRLWQSRALGDEAVASRAASRSPFLVGLLTSAANPASNLFCGTVYVAVLPDASYVLVIGLVTAVLVANSLLWYLTLAFAMSRPAVRVAYRRYQTALNRLTSALIGLLGLSLVGVAVGM